MNGEDYEAAKPTATRTLVTGDPWVRDHLPECPMSFDDYWNYPPADCCCDRLRACEQRVRQIITNGDYAEWRYGKGYAAGVQAARDAVAAQCGHTKSVVNVWRCDHDRALAAIDALRGDA